jgi:hypothetical protein
MAYTNPILGAVQSRQTAQMQNKQFEASFGLQLAQFAENKANSVKDDDYRKTVLGDQRKQNEVINNAAQAAVDLEAKRYDSPEQVEKRAADTAATVAQTAYSTSAAAVNNQTVSDAVVAADKKVLGQAYGWMQSRLMDNNGLDIPLEGNPQAQADFTTFMNMPGVNKTIQGKNGEQYEFVGIVPAGEDRSVVQIRDPNNPNKVMYMSRDRTAVEGDPLTAVNLMGIKAFREKISIAVRQAADKDLPTDLRLAAEAFNQISGRPKDQPQTLSPDTLQESQNLAEEMTADQQQPAPDQVGRNRTVSGDYTKGITPQMAVADPSAHDLSQYTHDELNSLSPDEWEVAIASAKKRMDTMRMPGQGIDQQILQNQKRQEAVTDQINNQTGPPNKGLQQQLDTLIKLGTTLSDRKAAGNDTFDAAQKAHNDLLDAKDFADGKKPAPSATAKAAAKIVADSKLSPRQLKNPDLDAAVDAEILKNPPPRAEIAQAIIRPMKMTPGLLYKLRAAQSMGMIDEDAIARVVDLGVLSVSGAENLKQKLIEAGEIKQTEMNIQGDLVKEAMKIEGDANSPYMQVNADGSVNAVNKKTGAPMYTLGADTTDGRSQADKAAVLATHTSGDELDSEESMLTLARMGTVSNLPELEQNILGQHLQGHLIDELGITGIGSFIDWVRGSDEDDVHNQLQNVQKNFAYDPLTKEIMLFDAMGNQHGDRDYYLDNLDSEAVKLLITEKNLLKTPKEVQRALKVDLKKKIDAKIAAINKLKQGV